MLIAFAACVLWWAVFYLTLAKAVETKFLFRNESLLLFQRWILIHAAVCWVVSLSVEGTWVRVFALQFCEVFCEGWLVVGRDPLACRSLGAICCRSFESRVICCVWIGSKWLHANANCLIQSLKAIRLGWSMFWAVMYCVHWSCWWCCNLLTANWTCIVEFKSSLNPSVRNVSTMLLMNVENSMYESLQWVDGCLKLCSLLTKSLMMMSGRPYRRRSSWRAALYIVLLQE